MTERILNWAADHPLVFVALLMLASAVVASPITWALLGPLPIGPWSR